MMVLRLKILQNFLHILFEPLGWRSRDMMHRIQLGIPGGWIDGLAEHIVSID